MSKIPEAPPWFAELRSEFPGIKSGAELAVLDIPPPKFLIPGLLPVGLTVIAGPPKIGKSYMMMQFAKEIIDGGGTVFYSAGEDADDMHKERQAQTGLADCWQYIFQCGKERVFSSSDEYRAKVHQFLEKTKNMNEPVDAVMIDTMRSMMPDSYKNDYEYYTKHLDPWSKLAFKYKASILASTHSPKGAKDYYPNPLDHVIGSVGIQATADWILVMQSSEDGRGGVLHSIGKMGADLELSLQKKNGIFYEIDGLEKDRKLQRKKAQNRIVEYVTANPGIRQVDIAKALNMDKGNVSVKCKKLMRGNYIYMNGEDRYYPTTNNSNNSNNLP